MNLSVPYPMFFVSPVLRYRVRGHMGGNGAGDLWPVWYVDRETRQRNLLGWPLERWWFDATVAGPFTSHAAAVDACREAANKPLPGAGADAADAAAMTARKG